VYKHQETYRGILIWFDENSDVWRSEIDEGKHWETKSLKLSEVKKRIDKQLEEVPKEFKPIKVLVLDYNGLSEGEIHLPTLKNSGYRNRTAYVRKDGKNQQCEIGTIYLDTEDNRAALETYIKTKAEFDEVERENERKLQAIKGAAKTLADESDILSTFVNK